MYTNNFNSADDIIRNLRADIVNINDAYISSRYVGFVAVAAVSVYEMALKQIFIEFAERKHRTFGVFTSTKFNRINGKIKNEVVRKEYIKNFGDKYLRRFDNNIEAINQGTLALYNKQVKNSYSNVITTRNGFAHGNQNANNSTFNEIVLDYEVGKEYIRCVFETMVR